MGGGAGRLTINAVLKAWHRPSETHLNVFSGWEGDLPRLCKTFLVVENTCMSVLKHKPSNTKC